MYRPANLPVVAEDEFCPLTVWFIIWSDENSDLWWWRPFYEGLRKLDDLKWWFNHRFNPRHRYNVVHSGLEPGYYDTEVLMEACLIKLFTEFIDKELPFNTDDLAYYSDEELKTASRILALHQILKGRKPWEIPEAELTGYLHELINLRKWFWT